MLQFHNLSLLPGTQFYNQREKFNIKCDAKPPRHVTESSGFSLGDMAKAKELATRTDIYFSLPEVRLTLLHVQRLAKITLWEAFEGFLLHMVVGNAIVENALLKYFKKTVISNKTNDDIYARLADAIVYISTAFGRAPIPDTINAIGSIGRVFEFAVDEMTLYDYFDEDFNISQVPLKRFTLGSSPSASAGSDLSARFRG